MRPPVVLYVYSSVSPSGSVAVVVKPTDVVAVVGHVAEVVSGGHGIVIVEVDAANELITGGWFGNTAGSRLLRCPAQNWNPKPLGSSDGTKPFGNPLLVAARVVPGTITMPRPGTLTPVICWTLVLKFTALK